MTERTAHRMVEAAHAYGSKSVTMSDLTPSVLYTLAAPSIPEPVREAVKARSEIYTTWEVHRGPVDAVKIAQDRMQPM